MHEYLGALLGMEEGMQVVGLASNGREAIKQAKTLQPDLILMDVNMPGLNGIQATRLILEKQPGMKVLFYAAEPTWRTEALAAGGAGFLLKDAPPDALIAAIRQLATVAVAAVEPRVPVAPARAPLRGPHLAMLRRGKRFLRHLAGVAATTALIWAVVGVARAVDPALLLSSITLGRAMASLSLAFGLMFFLYATKYYGTIGLLLLSSGAEGVVTSNGHHNGQGQLNGNGRWRRLRNGSPNAKGNGNGLSKGVENSLNKNGSFHLEEQPFVSIHLPMYNEKRVINRLLEASTSLNYENYEVIIGDDSFDATLDHAQKWAKHPRVKVSHRINRTGFKGAALQKVLEICDPRTEYVIVLDADFIPPPDIVWQFLAYFYSGTNGNGKKANGLKNGAKSRAGNGLGGLVSKANGPGNHSSNGNGYADDRVAAVQGYQWHMLNADENWVTKGIRAEYSGSYVIERSGQELLGSMKMISGSVYMIRADVLKQIGWGTSITEDWELTIKLYLAGYKVLYTPFIQAPAECVSNFRRLTQQRMRWAEGHTHQAKKYFRQIITSPHLSIAEKLEFIYYAPYYLQSVFFMVGTAFWFISETILHQNLPYWSALLGWSLVFSNTLALMLMNLSGLFLERGVKRDFSGVFSSFLLSILLVPFQAYGAIKGLLETEEGGWVRTPKTGAVTGVFGRLDLGGRLSQLLLRRRRRQVRTSSTAHAVAVPRAGRLTPTRRSALAYSLISLMVVGILGISLLSPLVPVVYADPDIYYLRTTGLNDGREMTRGTAGTTDSTLTISSPGLFLWYSSELYPTGQDDASIASGAYTSNLDYKRGGPGGTITFTAQVGLSDGDGSNYSQFGESGSATTADAGGFQSLSVAICSGCAGQTITASAPKRLVLRLNVTSVAGAGIEFRYDGSAGGTADSNLSTPTVVVPEGVWAFLAAGPLLPLLVKAFHGRRQSRGPNARSTFPCAARLPKRVVRSRQPWRRGHRRDAMTWAMEV